jgi:hypothetical protein
VVLCGVHVVLLLLLLLLVALPRDWEKIDVKVNDSCWFGVVLCGVVVVVVALAALPRDCDKMDVKATSGIGVAGVMVIEAVAPRALEWMK